MQDLAQIISGMKLDRDKQILSAVKVGQWDLIRLEKGTQWDLKNQKKQGVNRVEVPYHVWKWTPYPPPGTGHTSLHTDIIFSSGLDWPTQWKREWKMEQKMEKLYQTHINLMIKFSFLKIHFLSVSLLLGKFNNL